MVAIGDDVNVLAEPVENGKVVGREAADAARRLLLVEADLALEIDTSYLYILVCVTPLASGMALAMSPMTA